MLKLIMNISLNLLLLVSNRCFASQVNNLLGVLFFRMLSQTIIAKLHMEKNQELRNLIIFIPSVARKLGNAFPKKLEITKHMVSRLDPSVGGKICKISNHRDNNNINTL